MKKNGVMECWSGGVLGIRSPTHRSITPIPQYSKQEGTDAI